MNIQAVQEEAVQLLREMIAIPSASFNEDAVCSHICCWMNAHGIAHERIGNNIVAEHICEPAKPTLMLCAHIDTVEPCEGYTFNPYEPENCPSNLVQGLGSNDDGASVVSMIAAYRYITDGSFGGDAIQNRATPLAAGGGARDEVVGGVVLNSISIKTPINIILVLTCEEERSGKGGMTGLWPSLASKVDFAIVGEPTGMKAAIAERGLLVIDATAEGVSGHAARNEGVNALYIALEDIAKLREHEFAKVSPRMGKVNLNVTQINAGSAHNVIPDRCSFVIDIRPTEQYTNQEILDELQAICKSRLTPRNLLNQSSATFEDSPLQKAAEELDIETFSSPTTSDWMRISCDAIKMGPGDSARSHKKDEYVTVEEISEGIKTYIEFIERL